MKPQETPPGDRMLTPHEAQLAPLELDIAKQKHKISEITRRGLAAPDEMYDEQRRLEQKLRELKYFQSRDTPEERAEAFARIRSGDLPPEAYQDNDNTVIPEDLAPGTLQ